MKKMNHSNKAILLSGGMALLLTACGGGGGDTNTNTDLNTQTPTSWTKQMGVTGANAVAYSATTDSSGNLYVAGPTDGGLDGNTRTGLIDLFLTKYDSAGVKQSTLQLGSANQNVYGWAVTTDAGGNVYLAGATSGGVGGNTQIGAQDYLLVKYNSNGTFQYAKQLGFAQSTSSANAAAVDSQSGDIYMTGDTTGGLGVSMTGSTDMFLVRHYAASGTRKSTVQLGVSGKQTFGKAVATDASGNVYVTGYTTGSLPGCTPACSLAGTQDMFLIKYDSAGVVQFIRQLGKTGSVAQGSAIAVDAGGNVYVAGGTTAGLGVNTLTGARDMFLVKYDSNGSNGSVSQLGVSGEITEATSINIDASGNVYVAGITTGGLGSNTQTGTQDMFVAKYANGSLAHPTVQQLGVSGKWSSVNAVTSDAGGNVYLAGGTQGGVDGNTLTGSMDMVVVKYDSNGVKQ